MDKETDKITKKIEVSGIVQGVGFRPFVYRLAKKYHIHGTIRNTGGIVEIITQSSNSDFDAFLKDLLYDKDRDYEIMTSSITDYESKNFEYFSIIESGRNEDEIILSPDLPICKKCEEELFQESNHRYQNPFISCMSCGPRYSIIESLPYDRSSTTMVDFILCTSCNKEYTSPENRRFHAQTISCDDCGPYLLYKNLGQKRRKQEQIMVSYTIRKTQTHKYIGKHTKQNEVAINLAVKKLKAGEILAIKGIGGYHFACSAFLEDTVHRLRKLKGREQKPFAVMFHSITSIQEYCIVTEEEKNLLESKARPIVLLATKGKHMAPSTNQESLYCGAFLPYTPLQILLTKLCGPLIMTSANITNTPIIKNDATILSLRSPYLSGILYNTRRIVRSVDDSVAKIIDKKPQLIRRSRGYVPYPICLGNDKNEKVIFAAGSDLKAAFCLYKNGNAVVSQYFGDLEEQTIYKEYVYSVSDLKKLLHIAPEVVACDLHPNYFSSNFAKSLNLPLVKVQHHHAHIASVMAEHHLDEKVIGVAFDGTGYGVDGNIWGSEFLVCEREEFRRAAHLSYTPMIGGDSSMRDAKKTATCFLLYSGLKNYCEDDRSSIIENAIKNKVNTILSSSMGRLFDAVSSILRIREWNTFEGECSILLEKEATLARKAGIPPKNLKFDSKKVNGTIEISTISLLETICRQREYENTRALALGFHYAVAELILDVCKLIRNDENSNIVALSGGVFQNTLLTDITLNKLRDNGFSVYFNEKVPPNDGCISLGQIYISRMTCKRGE